MDSEEKYPEIRSKLRNLEKVTAGDDFMNKLHMKIVEVESEKRHIHETRFDEPRGGFLKNLFGSRQYPWLTPAVGFTVLLFFVFYITYLNRTNSGNEQQVSSQHQENTEQKNIDTNKNPVSRQEPYSTTEPDKNLPGKEDKPGKDIAGDLTSEQNRNTEDLTKNNARLTDRDEVKSNRQTTLSESVRKNNSINETPSLESGPVSPDASTNKNDANKQKENSESSDEEKKMSLKKQETESIGDTGINGSNNLNEAIAESKKLKEKMSKINRISLEKIRDKVLQ